MVAKLFVRSLQPTDAKAAKALRRKVAAKELVDLSVDLLFHLKLKPSCWRAFLRVPSLNEFDCQISLPVRIIVSCRAIQIVFWLINDLFCNGIVVNIIQLLPRNFAVINNSG